MDRPERGETRSPPASKARPVCEKSQLEVNRSLLRGKGAEEKGRSKVDEHSKWFFVEQTRPGKWKNSRLYRDIM